MKRDIINGVQIVGEDVSIISDNKDCAYFKVFDSMTIDTSFGSYIITSDEIIYYLKRRLK